MIKPPSDDQTNDLIKRVAEGDAKAFRTLFDLHAKKVLGYSTKILKSRSLAEDVSQDVWIKVVKMAASFNSEGPSNFSAWLMTLTRNASLDVLRSVKKTAFVHDDFFEELPDVSRQSIEAELENAASVEALKNAIGQLPESQALVLTLWMTEDVGYEQIAQSLGTSVSGVKSLLFRARENLQKSLGASTAGRKGK